MVNINEFYCKGCYLCAHNCPKQIIAPSSKRNGKGYVVPFVVDPEECSNCKTCELICPEMAIVVEEGVN